MIVILCLQDNHFPSTVFLKLCAGSGYMTADMFVQFLLVNDGYPLQASLLKQKPKKRHCYGFYNRRGSINDNLQRTVKCLTPPLVIQSVCERLWFIDTLYHSEDDNTITGLNDATVYEAMLWTKVDFKYGCLVKDEIEITHKTCFGYYDYDSDYGYSDDYWDREYRRKNRYKQDDDNDDILEDDNYLLETHVLGRPRHKNKRFAR
eukprot:TRINITY_DN15213_c0_g1_i12.p1 TRINITY_DN15213_c0_g1~~TRINITY_DN15213_c0_g1_i12.p1  ORF type:complete len:205 (+),score=15.68 TRINITY_DN15213_c0_g1_i12:220-834(+)